MMAKQSRERYHQNRILSVTPCSGDWFVVWAEDSRAGYSLERIAAWALVAKWSYWEDQGEPPMPPDADRDVVPLTAPTDGGALEDKTSPAAQWVFCPELSLGLVHERDLQDLETIKNLEERGHERIRILKQKDEKDEKEQALRALQGENK